MTGNGLAAGCQLFDRSSYAALNSIKDKVSELKESYLKYSMIVTASNRQMRDRA